MNFSKFTIKNFRSFTTKQTLKFAQPQEGKIGSGITYIVGANNSGKTTLIEGIWLRKDQKIKASEKLKNKKPEFCLYEDLNLKRKLFLIREESYTLMADPDITNEDDLFEIVSSRRHWTSGASAIGSTREVISSTKQSTPRQQQDIRMGSMLMKFETEEEKYQEFIELVKKIIPEFTKWATAYEDNEYIEYTSGSGIKHKTEYLGDGVISAIRILAHLFEESSSGLIIDEPELSLHPLAQKKLAQLIAEYSQKRQIVISTHSPYFVSWEYIKNGAVLNRTAKAGDTNSAIYAIDDFEKYSKLVGSGNWQQPFLMDIVSREIFFQDNILFLEGQEDVGLLQEYFKDKEINFFGYGVRGHTNFEFALQLAEDLGIKKAAVLIDSSADSKSKNNETDTKKRLEKQFGSEYKILQWNKTDIRDKKPQNIPKKEGYFSDKGKLKHKKNLDDFNIKIQEIENYFK